MPYIITTKVKASPDPIVPLQIKSRHAVATLEDARLWTHDMRVIGQPLIAWEIGESGGTIGPLSGGTIIEVTPVAWAWIIATADDIGIDTDAIYDDAPFGQGDLAILAAYNARQED